MNLVVIDYDAGNLRSVETALKYLDVSYAVSSDPEAVANADKILVPGVGEAKAAMETLRARGLDSAVRDFSRTGKPMMGICIGAQIVLQESEERATQCLGLIPGVARKFPDAPGLKVPHMGWNTVTFDPASAGAWLFDGIPQESSFYFVHSYYPDATHPEHVLARCAYGVDFAAALQRDNIVATQFHPEKSGELGLRVLRNFLKH